MMARGNKAVARDVEVASADASDGVLVSAIITVGNQVVVKTKIPEDDVMAFLPVSSEVDVS